MHYFLGFDIGGTKCSASLGQYDGNRLIIRAKNMINTAEYKTPTATLEQLTKLAKQLSEGHNARRDRHQLWRPFGQRKRPAPLSS